ncbi:MAG: ABC transporter substrate-binding protein [Gammaproteobacteria bacterium]
MTSNDPTKNDFTTRRRAPFKIGVCMEFAGGTRLIQDFYDAMRLVLDECTASGAVDRPVELVIREVMGPMRGTNPVVIQAWRELAHEQNCIAIVGPEVTEANLALKDIVNAAGVPTISFCATFDWAGPYCFALQNGGFPDEAHILAGLLAARGLKRVAVFREDGIIGSEYFAAFRHAAPRYGVQIACDHIVGLFNTQAPVDPQVQSARAANVDAVLVFSAYGALAPVRAALAREQAASGWNPPKFMNTTWVGITAFGTAGDFDKAALVRDFEGWTGLDQLHEGNAEFQRMLDRFQRRFGRRPAHCYTALGFDHGRVIGDSLSRMKPLSPEGFRLALEQCRNHPACAGAPDNVIAFGPYDHRGYKGQYVTVREIRAGVERLVDVTLADLLPTEPRVLGAENAETAADALSGAGSKYVLTGDRTPHRIGVLQDFCLWAPKQLPAWYRGMQLAFEEAYACGIVDRPVEMVIREVEGPPDGDAADVIAAYRDLARRENVLAVAGPFITDMTQILRPVIEAERVPVVSYTATFKFAGDWCFQVPNGTFMDETYIVVQHLAKMRGVKRIGVLREDNPLGDEYYPFLRMNARRAGLKIAGDQIVDQRCDLDEMLEALRAIRAAGAEALVHIGYGLAWYQTIAGMKILVDEGWDVPRSTITMWVPYSGMSEEYGSPVLMNMPAPAEQLEGWVGLDQPHERNPVFQAYLARYVKRFGGPRPFNCYPALMYDIGRVLAEGIALARPATPDGLRRGLEQVRMVPATMGAPGTVISLGPWDHRGYKGRYIVMRGLKNGREGLVEDILA